jgi:outer membrane protein TolC
MAVDARRRLEVQSVRFATVLATDPDVMLEPDRTLREPWALLEREASDAVDTILSRRPDVMAARRSLEATVARTEGADADVWSPDLLVGLEQRYLGDSSQDIEDGTTYGAAFRWTVTAPDMRRVRERMAEELQARVRLVGAQQDALAEVRAARIDVERSGAAIPLAREALAASESNLEVQRERFRAGAALTLEVLQAQGLHAEARADLAASVMAHDLAQARWLAAAGLLERDALPTSDAPGGGDSEEGP